MQSKSKPLYQVITEHLLKQIQTNKLEPGDQIPTELELSETFDVSRITAMRAVKNLEQMGVVFRKKARGTFVNERKKWKLQAEESVDTPVHSLSIISVVLPFGEKFGYDILYGAEKAAQNNGYYITFHNSMNDPAREEEIIRQLREDGVKGIVLYPCTSASNIDVISDMLVSRYPFVVLDRNIIGLDVPYVVSNNFQGSYEATAHLISLGHRKIAFLCMGMRELQTVEDRYRGYCKALIDAGIPVRKEWMIDSLEDFPDIKEGSPDYQDRLDDAVLNKWFFSGEGDTPTAIVTVNDVTAVFLSRRAIERGIRIPEELSLTGFDNLSFAEHLDVPLTTVEQSFLEMGEQAAAMLIDYIHMGVVEMRKIMLDTRLIIRQSTCAPADPIPAKRTESG